jgi:hypothetical protein
MAEDGFLDRLPVSLDDLIQFAHTPEEAMQYVTAPQKEFETLKDWVASAEAV